MDNATPAMLSGCGDEFVTEAWPGALPPGRNSPQKVSYGLHAEQGTAFTVPRARARWTWLYRIRPSARHGAFRPIDQGLLCGTLAPPTPNQVRWDPLPIPDVPTDFAPHKLDGTLAFMVGTSQVIRPSAFAMAAPQLQLGYDACRDGLPKLFTGMPLVGTPLVGAS